MSGETRPTPPLELIDEIRADPWRAPERIALAAGEYHGPAARDWLRQQQARYAYDGPQLARMAVSKHASLARFGGAAMGLGGLLTMLPDIATLAWIQSRMVFYVAAAHGFDPRDPMRPAELLVLQQLYADPGAARRALDGTGQGIASAVIDKSLSGDGAIAERLLRMLGAKAGRKLAGRAIPGFAVLFNGYANERQTRALAKRALSFYGG